MTGKRGSLRVGLGLTLATVCYIFALAAISANDEVRTASRWDYDAVRMNGGPTD